MLCLRAIASSAAAPADRTAPGYWLVEVYETADWRYPNALAPMTRGARGSRWFSTATLAVAAELGYEPRPVEAWTWAEKGRILEPFYKRVTTARGLLEHRTGNPTHDVPAQVALDLLKATYTGLIGRLGSPRTAADPDPLRAALHRPDWRHAVVATSRANRLRQIVKIGREKDIWPVAVVTDTLLYVSDDPDPTSAWPGDAAKLGRGLGQYKPEGSALLVEHAAHLTGKQYRGKKHLVDPGTWAQQHLQPTAGAGGEG